MQAQLIEAKAVAIDTTQYSWNEIGNFEQFWDWLEQVYLPLMFNEQWYNSDPLDPLLVHTLNYQSRLVGGYRIGQTRVISLSLCFPNVLWCY